MKKNISIIMSLLFLLTTIVWAADTTYGPKVYHKQGGDEQVIADGGKISVESGGIINFESGASLQIGGANMTSSSAELNVLDGVTAGTAAANSAVVLGASKQIEGMGAINGSACGIGAGNFSNITVVGAVNAATAGIGAMNVTTVTGGGNFTVKDVIASGAGNFATANIGSGNFTSIKIAGANVVAAANDLNAITGLMNENSTITLSTAARNAQTATFQAKDATGAAITTVQFVRLYVADDSACINLATAAANNGVTVHGAGNLLTNIGAANVQFEVLTNAAGAANLVFNNTGGASNYTKYVCAVLPNRKIVKSAITAVDKD